RAIGRGLRGIITRSPMASGTFGVSLLVSCATSTIGFINDPPGRDRAGALSRALCDLRAVPIRDAGRDARSAALAAVAHCYAGRDCTYADARQLPAVRAFWWRARRHDLRAGPYRRERQVRAGADPMTPQVSLAGASWLNGGALARLLAVLDRDGEEA